MSEGFHHHNHQLQVKKRKWIHIALVLTSLLGYLEWGGNQHAFFFEIEWKVFANVLQKPLDLLHPAIGMPLTGQLALLLTLFQKEPGKVLSWIGFGLLSPIFLFVLFVSISAGETEILLSVLPFWLVASLFLRTWLLSKKAHTHHGPKSDLL